MNLANDTRNSDDRKLRFKATILYGIGELATNIGSGEGAHFCKTFLSGLTEICMQIILLMATDIEHFAKHGKRTTVSIEDVKLYARRNSHLLTQLTMEIITIKQSKQNYEKY